MVEAAILAQVFQASCECCVHLAWLWWRGHKWSCLSNRCRVVMAWLSWRSGGEQCMWKFRELPLLRISQELWVSLDKALERMLGECMDKASDFPDPRDLEVTVAAVHLHRRRECLEGYCV